MTRIHAVNSPFVVRRYSLLYVVFTSVGDENRYEGQWKDDLKHGDGKYFYLDKGQVLLGTWVDNIAKCGEMIDFNRETAADATQYPIPEVRKRKCRICFIGF